MIQKTRPVPRLATALLLILLLFLLLPITNAQAEDRIYEGTIELTGSFNGQFTLDSSNTELFALEGVVPGDSWKGKIHVVNRAWDWMDISILSIQSNLEDTLLYDTLDLNISVAGESLYDGSYGATPTPITEKLRLRPGQTITFDITVTLPKTAGNEVQNKEMDSTWTFEANYYGRPSSGGDSGPSKPSIRPSKPENPELPKEPDLPVTPDTPDIPEAPDDAGKSDDTIQTGVDLNRSNSTGALWLFVIALSLLCAVVIIHRVREETTSKRKEEPSHDNK